MFLVGPSNRAVTTLRYIPDKPYKLQINSVNTEVDIFGMTSDLFYIRHGKTFGFLPKNHLREKSRGNYPFDVEIDISNKRIDQAVREQNFLHEFLTAPQTQDELKINETLSEVNATETLPVKPQEKNEVPLDKEVPSPANPKPDLPPKDKQLPTESTELEEEEEEEDNDSGIDEDEDDDRIDDRDLASSVNPKPLEQEQPKLVAIPPSKDEDKPNEILKKEEPLALPVAASVVEDFQPLPTELNSEHNDTEQTKPEVVPDFIPMKSEVVNDVLKLVEPHIDNSDPLNVQQQPEPPKDAPTIAQEEKVEETSAAPELPSVTSPENNSNFTEVPEAPASQPVLESKGPEAPAQQPVTEAPANEIPTVTEKPAISENIPEQTTVEPAPVTESVEEFTTTAPELPDVPYQFETPQIFEVRTEAPKLVELIPEMTAEVPPVPPQNEIPVTIETVEVPEVPVSTEAPEIPLPEIIEEVPTPLPLQPNPYKPEPDALLKRFNEKLGNRVVESTGIGSAEPLNIGDSSQQHYHDHSHDHHHSSHDHHSHDHSAHLHNDKINEPEDKSPESPTPVEEEERPGFFAGLVSKFFGDKGDSEDHYNNEADSLSPTSDLKRKFKLHSHNVMLDMTSPSFVEQPN